MSRVRVLLALTLLATAGPLDGQSAEKRFTGVQVRLTTAPDSRETRGELLAVAGDTLWIASPHSEYPAPFRFADVSNARARTHEAGSGWTMKRVLLGWGLTSAGLMAACVQETSGCIAVPLVVAVPWSIIGGLAAWGNERGTWRRFPPGRLSELRPYARFPQGLPEGFSGRESTGTLPGF